MPEDPESFDESIFECASWDPECPVFLAYTFAVQACHLRDRLKKIEDILGDAYDLDHLKELLQAENDGRLVVSPCKPGTTVYTTHWWDEVPETCTDSHGNKFIRITTRHKVRKEPFSPFGLDYLKFGKTVFITPDFRRLGLTISNLAKPFS